MIILYFSWQGDYSSQSDYYLRVTSSTYLFKRKESGDFAKSGKTLTNSLVKTGLITDKRVLTNVGKAWLNKTIKEPDLFETIFNYLSKYEASKSDTVK